MARTITGLAAGALVLTACSDRDDGEDSADATGITASASADASGTATASGGDDGGSLFDVGGGSGDDDGDATAEGGSGEGCEKVDFVFVIDSSPSMNDEQQALLASFPGFITAIEETLDFNDFRVMVLDAGAVIGPDCDGVLGAGRTTNGSGVDCGLVGGNRYATEAQPDLTAAFSCMASRGAVGPSNEETMQSLMNGIGPLTGAGECNDGFLRDDAVLVVTIITDEEDDSGDINLNPLWDGTCEPADDDPNSTGDPQVWYDSIVTAKNNDPTAVVVLSLIGDCDEAGTCGGIVFDPLNAAATTGAEPSPRLREFTNKWGFGSIGPVCSADYAPFFEAAVSVIDNACDDFMPPG